MLIIFLPCLLSKIPHITIIFKVFHRTKSNKGSVNKKVNLGLKRDKNAKNWANCDLAVRRIIVVANQNMPLYMNLELLWFDRNKCYWS